MATKAKAPANKKATQKAAKAKAAKAKAAAKKAAGSSSPNKGGRPKKNPTVKDIQQIKTLASMFCSWAEIAAVIDWKQSTLQQNDKAKEAYKYGVDRSHAGLKRAQMQAALKGNPTMLIWLGKVHLRQKDNRVDDPADGKGGPALVSIGKRPSQ